LFKI